MAALRLRRPLLSTPAARWCLVVLVVGVALLTLGPLPRTLQGGVRDLADALYPGRPGFPRRTQVEVVANGVLLLPLGLLLPAAFPAIRYVVLLAGCVALPAGVELAQAVLLPGRVPSARDVVLNAAGASLGLLLARLLLRRPAPAPPA